MRPVLGALAASLPMLTGCLVPDGPFRAAAPRAEAGAAQAATPSTGRPPPPSPVYSVPHSAPPGPGDAAAAAPAEPGRSASDTCGAADLAFLVGRPRTEIPVSGDLTRRRVVCTTCPVTMDVRPERQTITYDSATKLVTKVACG